jgi:hypothetical protein
MKECFYQGLHSECILIPLHAPISIARTSFCCHQSSTSTPYKIYC